MLVRLVCRRLVVFPRARTALPRLRPTTGTAFSLSPFSTNSNNPSPPPPSTPPPSPPPPSSSTTAASKTTAANPTTASTSTPSPPQPKPPREKIEVIFWDHEKKKQVVHAEIGLSILDVAQKYKIDIEGACEGSLACSTCHVIMTPEDYKKLSEPTEEENDMLDLALGLTETSRLGCQIILKKELNGMELTLPAATNNQQLPDTTKKK